MAEKRSRAWWRAYHTRRGTYKALSHPPKKRKKRIESMQKRHVTSQGLRVSSIKKLKAYRNKYPFGARRTASGKDL